MLELTQARNHQMTVRKLPTLKSGLYVTKTEQAFCSAVGTVLTLREGDQVIYSARLTPNGWVERRFE